MTEHKLVLEYTCRACMKQNDSAGMLNLFNNGECDDLAKIFETFTDLEANPFDGLPPNVCSECYSNLSNYNVFRLKCISSDTILRKQSVFIKVEPILHLQSTFDFQTNEEVDYYDSSIDTKSDLKSFELIEQQESKSNIFDAKQKKMKKSNQKNDDNKIPKQKIRKRHRKRVFEIIYQCDLCSKKFFMKHRLEAHLRIHQGLKPYYCTECDKQFRKICSLEEHKKYYHTEQTENRHNCIEPGCDRTYKMKRYLLDHIRTMHTKEPNKEKIPNFICDICGKAFFKRVSLTKHVFTHTRESEYACTECPKKFATKYKLQDHARRHGGVRPFVCTHCGLTKYTQRELRIHVNLHTRETTYPCDKCPSVFGSKNNLWRHERIIHQGIRAFTCNYCNRSFGKAETLKHHVMIHTGEKPHICECGKRFIQIVALKRHQKTHLTTVEQSFDTNLQQQ